MYRLRYPHSILQYQHRLCALSPVLRRFVRYRAFEDGFDQEALNEARTWLKSFQPTTLPQGSTTFSRSSGPGGQHVNKCVLRFILAHCIRMVDSYRTETKATTAWPVRELLKVLPTILHPHVRSLKYYSKRADSIIIQAQTERSRSANVGENHQKLFEELQNLCKDIVPGETAPEKHQKYEAL